MKEVRCKTDGHGDIDAGDVFPRVAAVMIVIAIICALATGVCALSVTEGNGKVPEENERAAEFNAMPLAERKAIEAWTHDSKIDPETYLIAMKETEPAFILAWIHGPENVGKVVPIYLMVFVVIFSLVTFFSYCYEKSAAYYLCSLPFYKPYGWVLFFCMFMGWPVMLVSFVCMRVQKSEFFQEQRRKRREAQRQKRLAQQQEATTVQRLAEEELLAIAKKKTQPAFPEQAHQAFVKYIMNGQPKAYEARVQEATKKVEAAQQDLQKAGETVQAAQRKLGYERANLEQLQKIYGVEHSRKKAEEDWVAIKEARGVSAIVYNWRRNRLEITIKVRVPYEGELYDFGDFKMYIDGSGSCNCREIRSGVRADKTSTAPRYRSGDSFCFGSSLSTIEEYLGSGRYAEAITLVVECMHSVNDSYDEERIPDCFRKVSTVEKAKRRILRCNKSIKGA